jgi:hypothetical protein
MGLLDELKILTKPLTRGLSGGRTSPTRSLPCGSRAQPRLPPYAEAARPQEAAQNTRRPYVVSQQQRARRRPAARATPSRLTKNAMPCCRRPTPRELCPGLRQPRNASPQQTTRSRPIPRNALRPGCRPPQAKLMLVRPDSFEVAADIATHTASG